MHIKILLAGDGGQGIQSLSGIICRAAFANGLFVSHIPNYGLEQRGGVSLAYVQISDREVSYPKFSDPDLLLIMSEQASQRTREYRAKSGKVIDFTKYEKIISENKIDYSSRNIFFLGLITKVLVIRGFMEKDCVFEALKEKLAKKSNWENNIKAFETGFQIGV
ncbi:MAG TPA: 2-oxoacid:acceptor oxidoreductase family protein [Candidatus Magasanikbacteria bacterium]|nr:2-oxoacid:acceptor oxidoreductase family protein [Candidatus Magasanikbacteria bacterium]